MKNIIVLFLILLLSVFSCNYNSPQSSALISVEENSGYIQSQGPNGWAVFEEANLTERNVNTESFTGQKVFVDDSGKHLLMTITGDEKSVQAAINDPIFGIGEVDYNDPEVIALIEEIKKQPPPDSDILGTRHLDISVNDITDRVSNIRSTALYGHYEVTGQTQLSKGNFIQLTQGGCWGRTEAGIAFDSDTPANSAVNIRLSTKSGVEASVDTLYSELGTGTRVVSESKLGWWTWTVRYTALEYSMFIWGIDW